MQQPVSRRMLAKGIVNQTQASSYHTGEAFQKRLKLEMPKSAINFQAIPPPAGSRMQGRALISQNNNEDAAAPISTVPNGMVKSSAALMPTMQVQGGLHKAAQPGAVSKPDGAMNSSKAGPQMHQQLRAERVNTDIRGSTLTGLPIDGRALVNAAILETLNAAADDMGAAYEVLRILVGQAYGTPKQPLLTEMRHLGYSVAAANAVEALRSVAAAGGETAEWAEILAVGSAADALNNILELDGASRNQGAPAGGTVLAMSDSRPQAGKQQQTDALEAHSAKANEMHPQNPKQRAIASAAAEQMSLALSQLSTLAQQSRQPSVTADDTIAASSINSAIAASPAVQKFESSSSSTSNWPAAWKNAASPTASLLSKDDLFDSLVQAADRLRPPSPFDALSSAIDGLLEIGDAHATMLVNALKVLLPPLPPIPFPSWSPSRDESAGLGSSGSHGGDGRVHAFGGRPDTGQDQQHGGGGDMLSSAAASFAASNWLPEELREKQAQPGQQEGLLSDQSDLPLSEKIAKARDAHCLPSGTKCCIQP